MSEDKSMIDGVVYTSVFNPEDGRKNWQDMVTAFCYAFKKQSDATLLLKFVSNLQPVIEESEKQLLNTLHKLSPFDCRVVATNKHLSETDYQNLIRKTAYYVNTSHGEGQCMPLTEFLSCGVPAISPMNTAMLDYIDESIAFVVSCSPEITHWQHDERRRYRTLQSRINWDSLLTAYRQSYALISEDPDKYQSMSSSAIERMQEHCSNSSVKGRLEEFLQQVSGK